VSLGIQTLSLTFLALVAFASNSLLTRLALGSQEIDAATFTAIRLVSGALVLMLMVRAKAGDWTPLRGRSAVGPLALYAYAAPFSFAYLRLGAATGALVLFGVVQLTMIGYAILRGERPAPLAWLGLSLAAMGLTALTLPSAAGPDALGMVLMCVAGVSWAVYSLAGRGSSSALAANARSFLWSSPLALLVSGVLYRSLHASAKGILLASVSGALTSGVGYAIWYRALPRLTVTQAAVAQLSVPVIAALGAVALLNERLSSRLVLSGAAVLCGVGLVLATRARLRA
jgi:drug/metabolite transporter (DMT)-like permease